MLYYRSKVLIAWFVFIDKHKEVYIVSCPRCGSLSITFNREKQGEVRRKKGTKVIRSTVGICKDCGYTWNTSDEEKKKRKTWLWAIGWIFCFPIPVTILVWQKKSRLSLWAKIILTFVVWILVIAFMGGASSYSDSSVSKDESVDNTIVDEPTTESHLYDNAKVADLMNGFGTEKIGTITVTNANQADCTEDALLDWYVNYVQKNADSNYHVIIYNDVENKGVYSNGFGFIQKDIIITPDNGSYMLGDDAGSTYYTVDETAKKLTVQASMADSSIVEDIKVRVDAVIPEEYKNSKMYSVDVAGEEGYMDCNLTLVNESFAGGECQAVAEEIATKVKELDLGIGYFCIAFQSDDYTITAISNMDSLKDHDASEIGTKPF